MILLYRLLYLPGLLIGLPYYLLRMWRRGGYRKGFTNRFGFMKRVPSRQPGVKRVWIQAVSVGELMAIRPLLQALQKEPNIEVILTTTTSTGYRIVEERLAPMVAWFGVFPLDFWLFSRRAWKHLQPDLVVLMEGELWPEHIQQAVQRDVTVLLINARLSDRSFARHRSWKRRTHSLYRGIGQILTSSPSDQERFQELGWIGSDKIRLAGNLKMDVDLPASPGPDERTSQLKEFGIDDPDTVLLMGSSTWPGEEEALLGTYQVLKSRFPRLRLVIVPRHAERKLKLKEALQPYGEQLHFRSESAQADKGTTVYIADTTGELGNLTRFADIIFVGKTLPPNSGGQTPVEAAAAGKPLLFGPDMSNFRDISRQLLEAGAARQLQTAEDLQPALAELLESEEKRAAMGAAARNCIESNRGATGCVLEAIQAALF